ncbi:alpha/beta hydrolase [Tenacibaculum agarivorans]|uniref:alpha/beta hydrolase n=1 Tax=Tenacibaculum agarivorans TaxID=1908389 RepID=UPI0009F829FB|nr:alpha/beta hydrolase [Tenacibaculum agarivorans]
MKNLIILIVIQFLFLSCSTNDKEIIEENKDIPIVASNATYQVLKTQDIVYAEGLSHQTINSTTSTMQQLKLDAYVPNNDSKNRPAILLIHGGGFISGSKEVAQIVNLANYFASRGWVAFSINYRLQADLGTVPEDWATYIENNLDPSQKQQAFALYPASRDAKAAVRWLYANASKYNINTEYITVGGGSAGAITATMLGVTDPEDYTEEISVSTDPTLTSTNLDQPTKVHSILDFWGSGVTVEILNNVYNKQRFDTKDAPIIIMHGTEDPTVLFSEGEKLRDNYKSTDVGYEFYPLEGKGHGAWNAEVNGVRLEQLCFDFVVKEQGLQKQ